jgi:hypothetical protein
MNRIDNPFTHFYDIYSPPGSGADSVVFVHDRQSPDGRHMLVAVEALAMRSAHGEEALISRCFRLGTIVSPPHELLAGNELDILPPFHAGQVDPADPSHFTIQCGNGVIVDGWLRNYGYVTLEVRRSSQAQ